MIMDWDDFCFEAFEVFLKIAPICCIILGSEPGNMQKGGW